jgi:hypothetical protein
MFAGNQHVQTYLLGVKSAENELLGLIILVILIVLIVFVAQIVIGDLGLTLGLSLAIGHAINVHLVGFELFLQLLGEGCLLGLLRPGRVARATVLLALAVVGVGHV